MQNVSLMVPIKGAQQTHALRNDFAGTNCPAGKGGVSGAESQKQWWNMVNQMANFELAVTKTILREGGSKITKVLGDAGGETKYGISKRSYPQLEISKLTEADAKQIYRTDFWNPVSGDVIATQVIAEEIFDTAVNMGVKSAIKLVQVSLGLVVDGSFGPKSLEAVNSSPVLVFLPTFKLAKIARYAAICNRDPIQAKFLLGWINRTLGA